jgi:hypothetical protein
MTKGMIGVVGLQGQMDKKVIEVKRPRTGRPKNSLYLFDIAK